MKKAVLKSACAALIAVSGLAAADPSGIDQGAPYLPAAGDVPTQFSPPTLETVEHSAFWDSTAIGDVDGDGWIGLDDHAVLIDCMSGVDTLPVPTPPVTVVQCLTAFDADGDFDIDLTDYGVFQARTGHVPIPLRDTLGRVIQVGWTTPYSGRQTCGAGACHDVQRISNGFIHQQGRTDADGNIVMHDDFLDDGRWWVRSAGMYGRWSGGGGGLNRQTAGKNNTNESAMDMTALYWVANCGGCHVGGGAAEFDRDGERLYGYYEDTRQYQFGYERLGLTAEDVLLDGDYAFLDDRDGTLSPARWDLTGVAEPECLHCHRGKRTWVDGKDMHREWRGAVLGAKTELVDSQGNPVQAFAAAGTAGQGWFSNLDIGGEGPPTLQIDYSVGVSDGSLLKNPDGLLALPRTFLARPPRDQVCWGCHLPGGFQNKRGTVWFDERDVHFKKFTNRSDADPRNDVPDEKATTCNYCHPGDLDHNFAKGDSPYTQFRNELDWVDFRTCRDCHLTELPNGQPNPFKHPDAPDVPGEAAVHLAAGDDGNSPMRALSCQACHVPYPLERGIIVTDRSLTGTAVFYYTDEFLSADPLDPANPDKSKWYPALLPKVDSDGVERLFPQKMEVAIYWADWDQNGTPQDTSDDTIHPIILWRVRQITGNQPLPVATDDNGDGKLEVNRPQEMLVYMKALRGLDSYGRQVAANPVLVKGNRIWYFDPQSPDGVGWFDGEASGIEVKPFEIFGLDHNVLVQEESWGAGELPDNSCAHCHTKPDVLSPVIDRLVLVDPFDVNGRPVYTTVREMTGINPP